MFKSTLAWFKLEILIELYRLSIESIRIEKKILFLLDLSKDKQRTTNQNKFQEVV